MTRHIRTVANLLIAQGGLEIVLGGLIIAFDVVMGFASVSGMRFLGELLLEDPEYLFYALGPVFFAIGVLKVVAGLRNRRKKNRRLGLLALGSGAVSLATGVCAPTGLALCVFGCMVYRNAEVRQAFRDAEAAGN